MQKSFNLLQVKSMAILWNILKKKAIGVMSTPSGYVLVMTKGKELLKRYFLIIIGNMV